MRTSASSIRSSVALRISGVGLMIPSRRRRASSIRCAVIALEELAMRVRSELSRTRFAERIADELDLRARAGLVIEIEQEIANRAPLDRRDQAGDGLSVAGRDGSDLGRVELAHAAKLASIVGAGEGEHARPRRTFFLEDDQRARRIQQQVQLFGKRRTHEPWTVSLPERIAAARSRTSAG